MQIGSNLFDMRARDYTPATGQFLSNDPIGLNGGDTDVRRYAGNDPVEYVDPVGEGVYSAARAALGAAAGELSTIQWW